MAQGDPLPGLGRIALTSTNPNIGEFSLLASNIITIEDTGSVRVVTAITDHFSRNPKIQTYEVSTAYSALVDSDQMIALTRAATDNSAAKAFLISPCQINVITSRGSGATIVTSAASKINTVESKDDITEAIEAMTASSVGGSIVVLLTAAQIKTGNSIPIDSGIPLPGEGKAIQITSAARKMISGSVDFTNASIYLLNTSADITVNEQAKTTYDPSVNDTGAFALALDNILSNNIIENEGIKIQFDSDSVVGDGSGIVLMDYIIRNFN